MVGTSYIGSLIVLASDKTGIIAFGHMLCPRGDSPDSRQMDMGEMGRRGRV